MIYILNKDNFRIKFVAMDLYSKTLIMVSLLKNEICEIHFLRQSFELQNTLDILSIFNLQENQRK